jgi:hypothetical protein
MKWKRTENSQWLTPLFAHCWGRTAAFDCIFQDESPNHLEQHINLAGSSGRFFCCGEVMSKSLGRGIVVRKFKMVRNVEKGGTLIRKQRRNTISRFLI